MTRLPVCRSVAIALACCGLAAGCGTRSAPVEPPPPAPQAATAVPTPTATWAAVARAKITTDDLNVRSGPGGEYPVVARLQPGDEVPVSGRNQAMTWLALTGMGWTAYASDWQSLPIEIKTLPVVNDPDRTFALAGAVHPLTARAGIPAVDALIATVTGADRQGFAALLATAGVASPTPAASSPEANCDAPQPAALLAGRLDAWFHSQVPEVEKRSDGTSTLHLYAVTRPADAAAGTYLVVFAFEHGEGRALWLDSRGRALAYAQGCRPTMPGNFIRVAQGETFFWFRPALTPPEHAVP